MGSLNELVSMFKEVYVLSTQALEVIKKYVHRTPMVSVVSLNEEVRKSILLKLENMQKTGSFKVRGALFKIHRLLERTNLKGVVTASSGNHAQGVAYAAKAFGVHAVIVMPETASPTKVNATMSYGADVVLHGKIYDDAYARALTIASEKGYEFIHPFDDVEVIAGQGTIALEVIDEVGCPDEVLVPIGGGGLASGVAIVMKTLCRNSKVIGVQPLVASTMKHFLRGEMDYVPQYSIADGVIVKKPGEITSKIIKAFIDDIVLVDEEHISRAIFFLMERGKIIVEGAGALTIAALLSKTYEPHGDSIIAVISGGNIDPPLLSRIIMHEMAKAGRLVAIEGVVDDKPGVLHDVLEVLAINNINVVDVRHDRYSPQMLPTKAIVEVVFEALSYSSVKDALRSLERRGFKFKVKHLAY
ncbi:MAG: threonine ammonia-lyase [Desulfurococcaceae archaeon]|nr:threonine ammonia-lyase [Sulfolobales archaeon]MDW8170011.1 threonine ammonia-lyase [Desulfurococcaceae archaeon]